MSTQTDWLLLPFDYETGEVTNMSRMEHIDKLRSRKELEGYLEVIDISKFVNRKVLVDRRFRMYENGRCPKLGCFDMCLFLEELSHPCMKLMSVLSDYITYHNYGIIENKRVMERLGWKRNMYNKQMRLLRSIHCIKIPDVEMENGGEKLVQIHPLFQFYGSHPMRDKYLEMWLRD